MTPLPPKKGKEEKETGDFQGGKRLDLAREWDGERLEAVEKNEWLGRLEFLQNGQLPRVNRQWLSALAAH